MGTTRDHSCIVQTPTVGLYHTSAQTLLSHKWLAKHNIVSIVNAAGHELKKFPREAMQDAGIRLLDVEMDDSELWVRRNDATFHIAGAAKRLQEELRKASDLGAARLARPHDMVEQAATTASSTEKVLPVLLAPSPNASREVVGDAASTGSPVPIPAAAVLVNCAMGRSRSSAVVLWWILAYAKPDWSFLDALSFLRSRRHWAYPRIAFCRLLVGLAAVPGSDRASISCAADMQRLLGSSVSTGTSTVADEKSG